MLKDEEMVRICKCAAWAMAQNGMCDWRIKRRLNGLLKRTGYQFRVDVIGSSCGTSFDMTKLRLVNP